MSKSIAEQIIFPSVCIFCRRVLLRQNDEMASYFADQYRICRKCISKISFRDFYEQELPCLSSHESSDNEPEIKAVVPLQYQEKVISAVRALKFSEAVFFAPLFAFFISKALDIHNVDFDVVVPVPLSDERLRSRGYNQAELIGRYIALKRGRVCTERFLLRQRHTMQQSRLKDPSVRAQNVSNAFRVPESAHVEGLRILLVDDVVTTGSTLYEAAHTLYMCGAETVWVSAVASGRNF